MASNGKTVKKSEISSKNGNTYCEYPKKSMETREPATEPTRSVVASVIEFEASENPPWRTSGAENCGSVSDMLNDIVKWQEQWNSVKGNLDEESLKKVEREFLNRFIFHVNTEEEHGCRGSVEDIEECLDNTNSPANVEEQETVNIRNAYSYLDQEVKKEEDELLGLLELKLVQEVHKIILENVAVQRGGTPPGKLSSNPRRTTWKGETYEYQNPRDMESAVNTLLDRYNDLLYSMKSEDNSKQEKVYKLFRICSWLIFEFLDLHPFGDGNGRLCRLLCSYILSVMTPFPTPIYNIWSSSRKEDYKQALVDARKSASRHPSSLATMIIECNRSGWQEFLKKLGVKDFLHK